MAELDVLVSALDDAPTPVEFWWRDDDCGRAARQLTQLLHTSGDLHVPLALAVVPAWLEPEVADDVRAAAQVTVLQHGWEHASHAACGERKIELGGDVDRTWLADRLSRGKATLEREFGSRFRAIMVPPWNRIAADVAGGLGRLGFMGLSAWPSLPISPAADRLVRRDTQFDPFMWHPARRYIGLERMASTIAALVHEVDDRPIGLLSHHLVFDAELFHDWQRLLALLRKHPNSSFLSARAVFQGAA